MSNSHIAIKRCKSKQNSPSKLCLSMFCNFFFINHLKLFVIQIMCQKTQKMLYWLTKKKYYGKKREKNSWLVFVTEISITICCLGLCILSESVWIGSWMKCVWCSCMIKLEMTSVDNFKKKKIIFEKALSKKGRRLGTNLKKNQK